MDDENGKEEDSESPMDLSINLIDSMKRDELVEYIVEYLGDEISESDREQLQKGLSMEQIDEYKQLIISALKENTYGEDVSTTINDNEEEVSPEENTIVNPTNPSIGTDNNSSNDDNIIKPEIEVITLDDDEKSDSSEVRVIVPSIIDLAEGTGAIRNLDNFSISEIQEIEESSSPSLRKVSPYRLTEEEDETALSQDFENNIANGVVRLEQKIASWAIFSQKEISNCILIIDIPENEEENFYQNVKLYSNNDKEEEEDDKISFDNLSLPSGGKTDFFFNDPSKLQPRQCTVDSAKAHEYCGAGLLGAKMRIGPICDNEEETSFKNIFNVIHGYERHNFMAKCNLCNGEVITDQVGLGQHVVSDSHRRNLVESSLKLIGVEAKFCSIPKDPQIDGESSPSLPDLTENTNCGGSIKSDSSKDKIVDKEEVVQEKTQIMENEKLTDLKEEQGKIVQVFDQLSSCDNSVPSTPKLVTETDIPLESTVARRESIHSSPKDRPVSRSRSTSRHKSQSRSGDVRKEEDKRSHRHHQKKARRKSRSRRSSSRDRHYHRRSSSRDSSSRNHKEKKRKRSRERNRSREREKKLDSPIHLKERPSSSHSVKSKKDDAIYSFLQSAEAKQLDLSLFNLKLTLIAIGKWTDDLERRWKLMEEAQKELLRTFTELRGKIEDQLLTDPIYGTRWTAFWERRYEELVVDENRSIAYADSYDYGSEWKDEWAKISKGLVQKKYDTRLQEIRLKYGVDLDTLKSMSASVATVRPSENKGSSSYTHPSSMRVPAFQGPPPVHLPPPTLRHPSRPPPLLGHYNPSVPPPPPGVNFPPFHSVPVYPPSYNYPYSYPNNANNSNQYSNQDPRALWGMPIFHSW